MNKTGTLTILWFLGFTGVVQICDAQTKRYPTRPIQFIVSFAPGGAADVVARMIGPKLTEAFGQPVVVQNILGASGNIAAERAAKSPPDGHTLYMGSSPNAVAMSLFKKVPFDIVRDFTAVTLIGSNPQVLVVNPVVPAKSVMDLIRLAKSRPGVITFGSAGAGAASHLGGELLNLTAGLKLRHIPYKGAAPALLAVVGGEVDIAFVGMSVALPHIKSNRLRPLAVASPRRSAALPDLKTFDESGVPDFYFGTWIGVLVPRGTPAEAVDRLHSEIVKILRSPDIEKQLFNQGIEIVGSTPEDFSRHIDSEVRKWARVIRDAGIQQK